MNEGFSLQAGSEHEIENCAEDAGTKTESQPSHSPRRSGQAETGDVKRRSPCACSN